MLVVFSGAKTFCYLYCVVKRKRKKMKHNKVNVVRVESVNLTIKTFNKFSN